MADLDTTDPTFLADLRRSKVAVTRAAEWLSGKGIPVIVRPTFERPTAADRLDYGDSGDLEIVQRVEVKRRGIPFTSALDFPFESIIVDVCHSYDRARPKPYSYIIFNDTMTVAAIVESRSRHAWVKRTKRDGHAGREREFYECPINLVRFETLPTTESAQ